ncbi:MAG: response regulator [Opitutaceae bacterium]|nr:response regulator [Opitutaceae bacterium]
MSHNGVSVEMLPLRRMLRLSLNALQFYRLLGAFMFSVDLGGAVTYRAHGRADGKIQFEMNLKPGARPSRAFFMSGCAGLASFPEMIGYPRAKVETLVITDCSGIFLIEPPEFKNLFTRLVSVLEAPLRMVDARSMALWHRRAMSENLEIIFRQKNDFESVLDASTDAIVVMREGQVLHANQTFAAMFELGRPIKAGTSSLSWLNEDQLRQCRAWTDERATQRGRADIVLTTENGRELIVDLAAPQTISWENMPATLWMFRDVSEERELARAIADASERERRRIAHDLHDGLGQEMAALGLHLKILQNNLDKGHNALADEAGKLVEMSALVARHARDIAHGLAPVELVEAGLVAALRWLAAHTQDIFLVKVSLVSQMTTEQSGRVSLEMAVALYRAAQEILDNARKHGGATQCALELCCEGDRLKLQVADDGVGLPSNWSERKGLGLLILQHRIKSLGGSVTVTNREESKGALVMVFLPLLENLRPDPDNLNPGRKELPVAISTPGRVMPPVFHSSTRARDVAIIDDHAAVADGVESLLSQTGRFRVVQKFASGTEFFETNCDASIVIVDLCLEGGSGIDMIRRLRLSRPALPIVAFSMGARELFEHLAREAGANAFVSKHDPAESLVETLDRLA